MKREGKVKEEEEEEDLCLSTLPQAEILNISAHYNSNKNPTTGCYIF